MSVKSMQDLFVQELRDVYHAEKQAVKAYPRVVKGVSSTKLGEALQAHLEETRHQVERLEQVFEMLDLGKRAKPCEAMQGLIEEAREIMEEIEDPQVRDVAVIAAGQKMEHYEIASYGTLVTLAKQLGHGEAAELLAQSLEEEKKTDQKLNQIAVQDVNKKAMKNAAG